MVRVCNWGLYPQIDANQFSTSNYEEIAAFVKANDVIIARGNGRCYGDSSLQKKIFSTLSLNRIIKFDEINGVINCESGVLLSEILNIIIPKGYFLPVTPGTKFITIGGAVASNIHGKNHHTEGAIAKFIQSFELLIETGEILHCSKEKNSSLFANTIGGMGLTGIVISVQMQLKKIETSYINQTIIKAKNIEEVITYLEQYKNSTYAVAWIDCLAKGKNLGRSILYLGEHTSLTDLTKEQAENPLKIHQKRTINIPFYFPEITLNSMTIKLFNILFYHKLLSTSASNIIPFDSFFYPLDAINNWNKMYGKSGFTQYQFVIPYENGKEGLIKILTQIAESGCGAFLAVLKTFGKSETNCSPISFPMEGYTLAVDFKVNKKVFQLLNQLDEIVLKYNGRLYLTKDARMTAATFAKSYPNGLEHSFKFSSLQSQRLGI
ncbi:MAG: FAD-binding oxidoreductase [Bacteroidia bacterium]|nr:FAD-binding oxidoreductase [Bacteroidia bacterium]